MMTAARVSILSSLHKDCDDLIILTYRFASKCLKDADGGHARRIKTEPLIVETLYLVGPPGSKLNERRAVDLAHLAKLPMVLPGPKQGLRKLLEEAARKAGIELRLAVEAEALPTLRDLAARDLGHTVLPYTAVHQQVRAKVLRVAPITRPTITRQLELSRSIVRPSANAVRRFTDILKLEVLRLLSERHWRGEALVR